MLSLEWHLPSGFIDGAGVPEPLGTPVRVQSPVEAKHSSGRYVRFLTHSTIGAMVPP